MVPLNPLPSQRTTLQQVSILMWPNLCFQLARFAQALLIKVHKMTIPKYKVEDECERARTTPKSNPPSTYPDSSVCHIVATPRCCCLLHIFVPAPCRHHTPLLVVPALQAVQLFCCYSLPQLLELLQTSVSLQLAILYSPLPLHSAGCLPAVSTSTASSVPGPAYC